MLFNNISKHSKFTKTKLDSRSISFYILIAFCSIFYSAAFDDFRAASQAVGGLDHAMLIAASAVLCFALFFMLGLNRWIFIVTVPLLFYIGGMTHIYTAQFNISLSMLSAPQFFSNDAVSLIASNTKNAIYLALMFTLGIAIGLVRFFHSRDNSLVRKGQAFAVILILTSGAIKYIYEKYEGYLPMPFEYITDIKKYANTLVIEKIGGIKSHNNIPGVTVKDSEITTVLVMFENLSGVHFDNSTAPLITSEKMQILAYKPSEQHEKEVLKIIYNQKPLISIFKSFGAKTEWIDVSGVLIKTHPFITSAAKLSDTYIQIDSRGVPNPFQAIDYLDAFLNENKNGLLIINISGMPSDVSLRYSDIFANDDNNESNDTMESEYKNYTSYADAFIFEVSKKLKDRKSALITLGVNGELKEPYQTPAIIFWASPKLKSSKNFQNEVLIDNQTFDAAFIYHSILDCSGIVSEGMLESVSLCK